VPAAKGDFLLVDYVLKVKDTGEIIDTTMEEKAKEAGVYKPEQIYEPKLVILGEGWLIKGMEEALEGMEEGQEKEIEIPPEKAYGERDPSKVKVVPAKELSRRGVTPRVGIKVEYGGQVAVVKGVGSGRVTLDFNHPLSGKTLQAYVKLNKIISGVADKVKELVHRRVPAASRDKIMVSLIGNMAVIEIPEEVFTLEDIQFAKKGVARDVERYIPDIASIQFIETYNIRRVKKETEAKPSEEKRESEVGRTEGP